jgi:CO/xanthine dehydrogenase FAD-binding subunit
MAVARLAVTGVADRALRRYAGAKALVNRPADSAADTAFVSAGEGITFRGDSFASVDYSRHFTGVLAEITVNRALECAAARP